MPSTSSVFPPMAHPEPQALCSHNKTMNKKNSAHRRKGLATSRKQTDRRRECPPLTIMPLVRNIFLYWPLIDYPSLRRSGYYLIFLENGSYSMAFGLNHPSPARKHLNHIPTRRMEGHSRLHSEERRSAGYDIIRSGS